MLTMKSFDIEERVNQAVHWLGDLRLQALANYGTFRNFDLVKRCLYLLEEVSDACVRFVVP